MPFVGVTPVHERPSAVLIRIFEITYVWQTGGNRRCLEGRLCRPETVVGGGAIGSHFPNVGGQRGKVAYGSMFIRYGKVSIYGVILQFVSNSVGFGTAVVHRPQQIGERVHRLRRQFVRDIGTRRAVDGEVVDGGRRIGDCPAGVAPQEIESLQTGVGVVQRVCFGCPRRHPAKAGSQFGGSSGRGAAVRCGRTSDVNIGVSRNLVAGSSHPSHVKGKGIDGIGRIEIDVSVCPYVGTVIRVRVCVSYTSIV